MAASVTDWVSASVLTLLAAAVGINVARGTFPDWLRAKFLLTAGLPAFVGLPADPGEGLTPKTPIPDTNLNPNSSQRYADPLPSGSLMSGWGACRSGLTCSAPCCRRHKGIDLGAPSGTPVLSIAAGRVSAAGTGSGGCGLRVSVTHDDGSRAVYCHLSAVGTSRGARIAGPGVVVGRVGNTGNATRSSPHLHFELHIGGRAVDPTRLIGR